MSSTLEVDLAAPVAPDARLKPRARILSVARELFYRHGIRAVGVEAIAEGAGTNKMTLYRHFISKDELIAECLRETAREFDEEVEAIARNYAGDPRAQLWAWMRYVSNFLIDEADRGCALANAAVELPEKDHPARRVVEDVKRAQTEKLLRICHEAGYADPEGLADELSLVVEGARVSIQSVGVSGPAARLSRLLETIMASHEPKAPAP
jgi:AcrR family transcriptional regulator